jgi:hypothetical protein
VLPKRGSNLKSRNTREPEFGENGVEMPLLRQCNALNAVRRAHHLRAAEIEHELHEILIIN